MDVEHENVYSSIWPFQLLESQIWHKESTNEEKRVNTGESI